MPESKVQVSLEALSNLRAKLSNLSASLHEIYNFMNEDLSEIGNAWQDDKFTEFQEGYRPQIDKCEEIANAYEEWCKGAIDPLMEGVENITRSQVTPNGGSASVNSDSAAVGAGTAVASAKPNKISGFNTGTGTSDQPVARRVVPRPNSKTPKQQQQQINIVDPQPIQVQEPSLAEVTEKQVSAAADAMCAKDPSAKGNIRVKNTDEGSNYNLGGELSAKGKIKRIVELEGKVHGDYNSGKVTSEVTIEKSIDCAARNKGLS